MSTKTFTQFTAVTTLAAGDELVQWNASAAAARKITVANFIANSPNGGLAEKGVANTFTVVQTFSSASTNVSNGIIAQNDASVQVQIRVDGSAVAGTLLGVTRASAAQIFSNSGPLVIGTFSSHNLTFGTANTTHITLDTGGKLGLKTASPTAWLHTPASTTAAASIRIPSGTAPTSPNAGDLWFDGTNLKFRDSGGTSRTINWT